MPWRTARAGSGKPLLTLGQRRLLNMDGPQRLGEQCLSLLLALFSGKSPLSKMAHKRRLAITDDDGQHIKAVYVEPDAHGFEGADRSGLCAPFIRNLSGVSFRHACCIGRTSAVQSGSLSIRAIGLSRSYGGASGRTYLTSFDRNSDDAQEHGGCRDHSPEPPVTHISQGQAEQPAGLIWIPGNERRRAHHTCVHDNQNAERDGLCF